MSNLKLEAGKFYRTRDGRKAEVLYIVPEKCVATQPVLYELNNHLHFCCLDGRFMYHAHSRNSKDLISEWVEPVNVVKILTVRIYKDGSSYIIREQGEAMPSGMSEYKDIEIPVNVVFD